MKDIIYKTEEGIFSYRVAGVCIRDGKILLQHTETDPSLAVPGGQVSFGETHEDALRREFQEEMNVRIKVGELKWVGELFFPWDDKPCHQICLYYAVEADEKALLRNEVRGDEEMDSRKSSLIFKWVPICQLPSLVVYPENIANLLSKWDQGVQHFIYHES